MLIGLFGLLSLNTHHEFCMLNVKYIINHLLLSTTKKVKIIILKLYVTISVKEMCIFAHNCYYLMSPNWLHFFSVFFQAQEGQEGEWVQPAGFIKGKLCLANLVACFSEMISFVDRDRAVDVICLCFSKTINKVYHNILIDKLEILDKWTIRWVGRWLDHQV